jgi:hypothetical protein
MASTHNTPSTPSSGHHPQGDEHKHKDSWVQSIGKAIVAPMEGAHGGFTASRNEPAHPQKAESAHGHGAHHELPDRRDGRTVGKNDDGFLKSLGKAIVAPIEGAHEEVGRPRLPPAENWTK